MLEGTGAEFLDWLVKLQDLLDLPRDTAKTLHNILSSLLLRGAILTQGQCEHDHCNELGCVGLCRCNTNFRASVDVNTAVGEEGDGRTDNVDDTNSQSTTFSDSIESHERVSSLT